MSRDLHQRCCCATNFDDALYVHYPSSLHRRKEFHIQVSRSQGPPRFWHASFACLSETGKPSWHLFTAYMHIEPTTWPRNNVGSWPGTRLFIVAGSNVTCCKRVDISLAHTHDSSTPRQVATTARNIRPCRIVWLARDTEPLLTCIGNARPLSRWARCHGFEGAVQPSDY